MKKKNRILSLVLCAVIVLTLIPVGTLSASALAEGAVANLQQLYAALTSTTADYKVKLTEDIDATVDVSAQKSWATVAGTKILDLNGHTVKITVKNTVSCSMITVAEGAELTILDSSAKKTGALVFDADIASGNPYRKRIVLVNKGTLNIYGGDFTPGHYTSYYSAKYAKTVYKMTTGRAIENYGNCTIYGGRFVGRNMMGCAIYNHTYCPLTIYDAYLYTKGGADALLSYENSNIKIYAIKTDCNKEKAVEDDKDVTKGADYGYSGIIDSMLCGDYKIKTQKNSNGGTDLDSATYLEIVPAISSNPVFEGTETDTVKIPLNESDMFKAVKVRNINNPLSLKDINGYNLSYIRWNYTLYKRETGSKESYKAYDSGSFESYDLNLDAARFEDENYERHGYTEFLFALTPTYVYEGWNNTYTAQGATLNIERTRQNASIFFYDTPSSTTYSKYKGYYKGQTAGLLYTPTRAGYEFLGWYDAKAGGNIYTANTVLSGDESINLYGRWKSTTAPSFTRTLPAISYYNDGTEGINLAVGVSGGGITYKWEEYTSAGKWQTISADNITKAYTDGDEVTFKYTGSCVNVRCTASNSNGSITTQTAIGKRDVIPSSETDLANQFLMYVEDNMTVSSRGLVVTGKVVSGELETGSNVIVKYGSKAYTLKVNGIEMFRKLVDKCEKGDTCGLNLVHTDGTLIDTTDAVDIYGHLGAAVLGTSTTLISNTTVTGTLTLNATGGLTAPLENGDKFQLYVPGEDRTAEVSNLGGTWMLPGDTQTGVKLTLNTAAVMYYGQTMAVKKDGKTLGTFTVTNIANENTGYAKITYDYNGGDVSPYTTGNRYTRSLPAYKFIKIGDTYGTLPTPVKDGYALDYWNDGSKEVTATTKVTASKTVKAYYKPITSVTVNFNVNGGDSLSVTKKTMTVSNGTGTYSDLPTPTKSGYDFIGWTDALGNKAVNGGSMAYAVEHTLKANWSEALPVYPVFTNDLPEKYNFINDINGNKLSSSFSVTVSEDCYLTWYLIIDGKKEDIAVGNMSTLKFSDLGADLQAQIIENGATLMVYAKSKKTALGTMSTRCHVYIEYPEYHRGDINKDGKVNVADARIALRAVLNKSTDGYDFSAFYKADFLAADADENEELNLDDARMILRVAIGLEEFD